MKLIKYSLLVAVLLISACSHGGIGAGGGIGVGGSSSSGVGVGIGGGLSF